MRRLDWREEVMETCHLVSISDIPGDDSSLLDDPDELREGLRHDGAREHSGTAQQHVVSVVSDLTVQSQTSHVSCTSTGVALSGVT